MESIDIKCPKCGHHLRIPAKFQGETGQCKHCHAPILVPYVATEVIPTPPPMPPEELTGLENLHIADTFESVDVGEMEAKPVPKKNTVWENLPEEQKNQTIGCLALIIIVFGIWLFSNPVPEDGGGLVNEATPEESYILLNGGSHITRTTLSVKNYDNFDWVGVEITCQSGFWGFYKTNLDRVKAGDTVEILLNDLADGGKRFDPYTQKVQTVMLEVQNANGEKGRGSINIE